jgi:hypothetical protein
LTVRKCGAGEGWRSVGPIKWRTMKYEYYIQSKIKGTSTYNKTKESLSVLVISCVGNAF